jgi:hypothetical protein
MVTLCPAGLAEALGGAEVMRASGAFAEVIEIGTDGLLFRATEDPADWTGEAVRRVSEAVRPCCHSAGREPFSSRRSPTWWRPTPTQPADALPLVNFAEKPAVQAELRSVDDLYRCLEMVHDGPPALHRGDEQDGVVEAEYDASEIGEVPVASGDGIGELSSREFGDLHGEGFLGVR